MNSDPSLSSLPLAGRIAALDYGSVRIGVAITDPEQKFASPLENYTRRTPAQDGDWLQQLVKQERIIGLVVGLPLHTSGSESEKSAEVRQFVRWLTLLVQIPIVLFDERFTTSQANELLAAAGYTARQRKERRDKIAAQILLASYLESDRQGSRNQAIDDQH